MKNILILEDDQRTSIAWREAFEEHGHAVTLAYTAEQAVAVLDEGGIDLVVLDLILRDPVEAIRKTGGISVIGHINLKVCPKPKMITVSGANPQLHLLEFAKTMKTDRALVKPVTIEELLEAAEELGVPK